MHKLYNLIVPFLIVFFCASIISAQNKYTTGSSPVSNASILQTKNKTKSPEMRKIEKKKNSEHSVVSKKPVRKILDMPSSGGPDPMGYTFKDSRAPGGPVYNWIEISPLEGGTGTAISYLDNEDDEIYFPLNIPFPFSFYGIKYKGIGVSSNGMIAFNPYAYEYINKNLPTSASNANTGAFIAAFWDDLELFAGEHVYYLLQSDKVIIEYYNVEHYDGSDPVAFEVILYNNGNILFQYKNMNFDSESWDFGESATVGIQGSPDVALQYSYDAPAITNNLAVEFYAPVFNLSAGSGGVLAITDGSISLIDASTNTAYGPFLSGQLGGTGEGSGVNLGCVITPDGRTAVISSFDDHVLYFIDLSNPTNPVLLGSTPVDFRPEDMDVTPDGKFVLVTDGGAANKIVCVNVSTRSVAQDLNLDNGAQAVAISSDGQTVLAADYDRMKVLVFLLNPATGILSLQNTINLSTNPINITISPDGKTAVAVSEGGSKILTINSPGNVSLVGDLPDDPGNLQSCVFNNDGSKAYFLQYGEGESVFIYNVSSSGVFSYSGTEIPLFYSVGSSFYGINQIALDASGQYLFVNNYANPGAVEEIDLNSAHGHRFLKISMIDIAGHYYIPTDPKTAGLYASKNLFGNPLKVLSPNGGEIWQTASSHNITWQSTGVNNVNVELTTNGGGSWQQIANNVPAAGGSYNWIIGPYPYSTQCKVRVSDASNPQNNDVSDGFFTIMQASNPFINGLTLLSPNGGENWRGGSTQYIVFRKNLFFPSVKLEYTTDGGSTWNPILQYPLSGLTYYPWKVPLVNSSQCKVRVSNWNNPGMNVVSINNFTITTPTGAVNYPNPFNPTTTIQFTLLTKSHVVLKIYNSLGQQVAELANGEMQEGIHEVRFDASNLPSGVYYYEVNTGVNREIQKMLYLK